MRKRTTIQEKASQLGCQIHKKAKRPWFLAKVVLTPCPLSPQKNRSTRGDSIIDTGMGTDRSWDVQPEELSILNFPARICASKIKMSMNRPAWDCLYEQIKTVFKSAFLWTGFELSLLTKVGPFVSTFKPVREIKRMVCKRIILLTTICHACKPLTPTQVNTGILMHL